MALTVNTPSFTFAATDDLTGRIKLYEFAGTPDEHNVISLVVDRDATQANDDTNAGDYPAGTWVFDVYAFDYLNPTTEERIDSVEVPVTADDRYVRFDDRYFLIGAFRSIRVYATGTAGDDTSPTNSYADEHAGIVFDVNRAASIDAIKVKTDELTFTTTNRLDARLEAVGATPVTAPADLMADVSALALEATAQSVKTKTDELTFTNANEVDANVASVEADAVDHGYSATVLITRNLVTAADEYQVVIRNGGAEVDAAGVTSCTLYVFARTGAGMPLVEYLGTAATGATLTPDSGRPLFYATDATTRIPVGVNASAVVELEIAPDTYRLANVVVQQSTISA